MQNTIQKFRQSPIAFEKPGILPENLKTLTNYPTVKYFLRKLRAHFLLTNVYKRVVGFFLKDLVSTHSFLTLINNSRSKQNLKNPTHRLVDITK